MQMHEGEKKEETFQLCNLFWDNDMQSTEQALVK